MLCTVSPGPASPSCAAVLRCQVTPSREVQITACVAWLPVAAMPAARNPSDVLFSTHIASPFSIGVMPWVDASVQDRPFLLVQMACGPTAGALTGARRQEAPPLTDTKNCWRTTPSLVWEPIGTMVFPEATTRFTVWKTPRCCCPGYMPMVSADC